MLLVFFCCKQKTAYEMRISDWSSDVCSSDLSLAVRARARRRRLRPIGVRAVGVGLALGLLAGLLRGLALGADRKSVVWGKSVSVRVDLGGRRIIKKQTQQMMNPLAKNQ